MNSDKNQFKEKAKQIICSSPQSIKELLENKPPSPEKEKFDDPEKPTFPINENKPVDYTRVHIHIRQDLYNKVLDLALKRKKDRTTTARKASHRAIIEEALENFL